jgi:hypothetical protein
MVCELAGSAGGDRSAHHGYRYRESKIAVALGSRRSIPRFAVRPSPLSDAASLQRGGSPVSESDDEEDVKRLEQDRRDAEKIASPHVRRMPRQELPPLPGWAPAATHSHIFGHGPGGDLNLTLSTRPECAF